jgi:hypothetical protein
MRPLVPAWYWHRLRFAAFHYHTFWASFWPAFARTTDEICFVEWLLHMEPGNLNYRDHILHMFKVACLGTWLLEDDSFADLLAGRVFRASSRTERWYRGPQRLRSLPASERRELIRWAFLLAALLHDLGYAYFFRQVYDAHTQSLNQWMANSSHNSEASAKCQQLFADSLLASYLSRKTGEPLSADQSSRRRLTGVLRDHLTLNHSFGGALLILQLEHELRSTHSVNTTLRVALQLAAEAVALHDLARDESHCGLRTRDRATLLTKEDAHDAPLAVLLMFCDELAAWQRPRLHPRPCSDMEVSLELKLEECLASVELATHSQGVTVKLCDGGNGTGAEIKRKIQGLPVMRPWGKSFFGMVCRFELREGP